MVETHDTTTDAVVIVTGAARGMGLAIVHRLLADGYRVVAVDRDEAIHELRSLGATTFEADVSDGERAQQIVAECADSLGEIFGLINVAGIHRLGTALETSVDDWRAVLDVNLMGTVIWTSEVLQRLVIAKQGAIVNFASVAATHARPNSAAYVTSKTAVLGFTRSVATDFGPSGIRCNAISPGSIDTPMLRETAERGGVSTPMQAASSPLGRLGTVEEIAGAVSFLLSADGAFMNGSNVVVDGGRTAVT